MKGKRFEEPARRSRATEGGERLQSSRARFFLKKQLFLCKMLKDFSFRYAKYRWYIGTYHVYKAAKPLALKRLNNLSYLTDKLRKAYPKDTVMYITKEKCEDGFPHYHFLIGLVKDRWGCTMQLRNIHNTRLWSKEWSLGEIFNIHLEDDYGNAIIPFYVTSRLEKVDIGARQRWFKYGIYQYLLYIFKYSRCKEFSDYFVSPERRSFMAFG